MNVRARLIGAVAALLAATNSPRAGAADPAPTAAPPASPMYVYVLDGLNPLGSAGANRLGERLRDAGFPSTRVGGWYQVRAFEREIRATHAADPTARFAVIGYSAGAYQARAVANRLVQDGVPVAVVGYIGGDYLRNTTQTRVVGAGQVVNVVGNGYLPTGRNLLFNGTEVTGAWNVRLRGTRHINLPTHPATFTTLSEALAVAP
ncbi:hypothetical protein [Gemmata sp.]|uniref:hypothetical protein n=1 Tax=Gemmata sp. TaxID=1914242 RepID=UPI003F7094C8